MNPYRVILMRWLQKDDGIVAAAIEGNRNINICLNTLTENKGVCEELEILGCTDDSACNFDYQCY